MNKKYLELLFNLFDIRIISISKQYKMRKEYIEGQLEEACSQLDVLEKTFLRSKKRGF